MGIAQRILLKTVIGLHGVAHGIHARHGGDEGRHGHRHAGIENGDIGQQKITGEKHLQMFVVILDDRHQRHFRPRARRRRHGKERLQSPFQGAGAAKGHQVRRIFGDDDVDSLGRIHDGTAADGNDRIACMVPIKPGQLMDDPEIRIGGNIVRDQIRRNPIL